MPASILNPNRQLAVDANKCPNCGAYYLLNEVTGEFFRLGCKRYSCSNCGPKKCFKLRKALRKYFGQFKHTRLCTFTFRSSIFKSVQEQLYYCPKIWARFVTELRRCSELTNQQKKVDYVKIIEFTKAGNIHYHALVTEFLPWSVIQNLWLKAINSMLKIEGKNGHFNVKGILNRSKASNYVVKYITKSAMEIETHIEANLVHSRNKVKLWTKSQRISIFDKVNSSNEWRFIKTSWEVDNSILNLYILELTSQNLAIDLAKANQLSKHNNITGTLNY